MTRYQYHAPLLPIDANDPGVLEAAMNELGDEGWELVESRVVMQCVGALVADPVPRLMCVFRRVKVDVPQVLANGSIRMDIPDPPPMTAEQFRDILRTEAAMFDAKPLLRRMFPVETASADNADIEP